MLARVSVGVNEDGMKGAEGGRWAQAEEYRDAVDREEEHAEE